MAKTVQRDMREVFTNDTRQASILIDLLFIAGALAVGAGLTFYFADAISLAFYGHEITYEIIAGLVLSVPLGIIVGLFWVFFTRLITGLFFLNPVKAARDDKEDLLQVGGILAQALFSESLDNTYLQLQTPDKDYRNIFNLMRFSTRFVLSYISIFYILLSILLSSVPAQREDVFLLIGLIIAASFLSLVVVGLYQPIRMVTEDARVLIQRYDGTFATAEINVYGYINNFLVVSGLFAGYNLINNELYARRIVGDFLQILTLYLFLTVVILIIISPSFVPAMMVYRNFHSRIVNGLRTELAENGVQIVKINRAAAFTVLEDSETDYVLGKADQPSAES